MRETSKGRGRYVCFGSGTEDFRPGENARGMEGQCDCTNRQREGGHSPGLWELQRHQDDIPYHEDLGKNNRQKTEGGESI